MAGQRCRAGRYFLVDDRHAIAVIEAEGGRARDLWAIDLAHPEARELAWRTTGTVAGYEPSTHLLAINADDEIVFARVDPRTGGGSRRSISRPARSVCASAAGTSASRTSRCSSTTLESRCATRRDSSLRPGCSRPRAPPRRAVSDGASVGNGPSIPAAALRGRTEAKSSATRGLGGETDVPVTSHRV